ncbi:MAG: cell division protein FtsL [Neisseriaceae bacterium]|nr:cell division protein FtsL [Neisseriaceae bacterium]MBQ9620260.1 cell division protein FtsL [Neisseriaceae bacterium]
MKMFLINSILLVAVVVSGILLITVHSQQRDTFRTLEDERDIERELRKEHEVLQLQETELISAQRTQQVAKQRGMSAASDENRKEIQ